MFEHYGKDSEKPKPESMAAANQLQIHGDIRLSRQSQPVFPSMIIDSETG